MAALPRGVVERVARYAVRPAVAMPPRLKRGALEALSRTSVMPAGVSVSRQARAGVLGDLVTPPGWTGRPPRVMYLHGGAYEAGSPRVQGALIAALAVATDEAVFAPAYRLAPEHPAPAGLEDALAAYEAMAAASDMPLALAGDSAGAGLALASALALRERRLPPPAVLGLVSPWVDLTMSGPSYEANDGRDAMLSAAALRRAAARYAAALGPDDPACSPLFAELAGLAPLVIHAGGDELLLSDARELARRADASGVEVELRVFEGLWHDFHSHAGTLREADEAVAELGRSLARRLNGR